MSKPAGIGLPEAPWYGARAVGSHYRELTSFKLAIRPYLFFSQFEVSAFRDDRNSIHDLPEPFEDRIIAGPVTVKATVEITRVGGGILS